MVLWEITLGTAYFLGLKRTYRLALKIQRRLITPKHPKIRNFVRGKTRAAFDVALRFHKNIQERDIEVGRNFGNWILRWLDKMKPSAQIRCGHPTTTTTAAAAEQSPAASGEMTKTNIKSDTTNKLPKSSSPHNTTGGGLRRYGTNGDSHSGRNLFTASGNVWSRPFEKTMMRPSGVVIQQRFLSIGRRRVGLEEGVIRKDIMQWIMQHA
ncbi:uncharacterized protein LOC124945088 [Impatiens glandulifera]|uniref:uncharacterized protein LOC124945088 n=1 Tax=Impatiens glandulifera TaxID=253017 RepID=UPI001FB07523|nr:uncharacterized protein LOC124945088 [Impatiens glandulifera]XP_047341417.1 uncharacterized protein LOC124945088 [Impatiens glandulifera]